MHRIWRRIWIAAVLAVVLAVPASAKQCEFEFYYQKLEEVVQINDPNPQGWWATAKSWGKTAVNAVASTWEKAVTRNFFPGEGSKLWYSGEDKNIAYRVNRAKVKDEKHLLELMGAKNESELSHGQRAMLNTFRAAKSDYVQKTMMPYNHRSTVKVLLSDTTGFDDTTKYPHVTRDFWPYSSGHAIVMNTKRYDYPAGEDQAPSTFVHEFAHCLDSTMRELINSYGKDGTHYRNELTKKRSAFLEGWAEFNQMMAFPDEIADFEYSISHGIMVEDSKKAGLYKTVPPGSLSGEELLRVEGVNACIMMRMAKNLPGGSKAVFEAFNDSNYPWRSIKTFLRAYVKKNPGSVAGLIDILMLYTFDKLTPEEIKDLLGDTAEVRDALEARKKAAANASATPTVSDGAGKKTIDVNVDGNHPFGTP